MLFNSIEFLYFLPLVLLLYYAFSLRGQNVLLLIASYIFYGAWDWRFCFLLLTSTVVDFYCGAAMAGTEDGKKRWRILLVSICTNLGILGFFKYFNFFIESAGALLESAGLSANYYVLSIVLPVGISFYTFQTLSYTIDIYRGQMKPTKSFLNFAVYVAYFPQLVAGPIERAQRLIPQIEAPRRVTSYQILSGLWLILIGFFKKVAIADAIGPYVDAVYANPDDHGGLMHLGTMWLFALQIYGDFSGYTDIARGTSRLMGIELMVNFRQPYFAKNPPDLWRRWHISLSSYLRDYLYIPLGGNRVGPVRTYVNLMLTMLLGGLWHGAAWTYVVWGGMHGVYLMVHRWFLVHFPGKKVPALGLGDSWRDRILNAGKIALMFNLTALTLLVFRAPSFSDAFFMAKQILADFGGGEWTNIWRFAAYAAPIFILDAAHEWMKSDEPAPMRLPVILAGIVAALMFASIFIFGGRGNAFIYFQF